MMGEFDLNCLRKKTNGRQIEALHALLHGASYAEASEKAGVSEETLLDWMKYNSGLFRDIRDFRGNFKLPPLEWVRENLEPMINEDEEGERE